MKEAPEPDRELLINAIRGCGCGDYRTADEMTMKGLARFCGNQWNEDWEWIPGRLSLLTTEELRAIYDRVRK